MIDRRPMVNVSLVCTVRNEAGTIAALMESIAAQHVRPCEVIVVDGGSRDGTQLHVEWWHGRLGCPLRLIERPNANISVGRNAGIAAARAPVIAVTDAGVRLDPTWLERLAQPFADPSLMMVGGFFLPDPQTVFEIAMGATVLPALDDLRPEVFLPSSRSVAFRKAIWEEVGGYPEWLDYCEDLVFDLAVRAASARCVVAPEAIVHYRPRPTLRAFWHQYFRYARGDGKAGLWPMRHGIRYLTYAGCITIAVLGKRGRPLWPIVAFGAAWYLKRPYQRLGPLLTDRGTAERAYAIALAPLIRLVGDLAKMCGYPVGLAWRLRRYGLGWTWRQANAHDEYRDAR